ncbi:MAG: F0F1 ATP synthase subunit A [Planctomycetes bacterium]|nr:F0F1 ATP synthase subunit A [Planctomycetota bacterium]
MASGHSEDVFHHVRDSQVFELPRFLGGEWHIPQLFGDFFPITKFMVLEVVAGLITLVIFRTLAQKIANGEPVRGRFWNFWEAIALFLRDEVVRPTIGDGHGHGDHGDEHGHGDHGHGSHADHGHGSHGHEQHSSGWHPADKFLPYIWSTFFFILLCNLLGAIPWMGSPTGHIWVTGVLAIGTFAVVVMAGVGELGIGGFLASLVPPIDAPGPLKLLLVPGIFFLELVGLFIKHGVLAVRLFANIMAGHTVISVILGFILAASDSALVYAVAPASVLGQVGVGLLELFVAFLQAYVFVFLSTVFIGAATHPH